jgi:hypothetical protein
MNYYLEEGNNGAKKKENRMEEGAEDAKEKVDGSSFFLHTYIIFILRLPSYFILLALYRIYSL